MCVCPPFAAWGSSWKRERARKVRRCSVTRGSRPQESSSHVLWGCKGKSGSGTMLGMKKTAQGARAVAHCVGPAVLCWTCCASLSAAGCSASSPGSLSRELFGVRRMSPRNSKQLQIPPVQLFGRRDGLIFCRSVLKMRPTSLEWGFFLAGCSP